MFKLNNKNTIKCTIISTNKLIIVQLYTVINNDYKESGSISKGWRIMKENRDGLQSLTNKKNINYDYNSKKLSGNDV